MFQYMQDKQLFLVIFGLAIVLAIVRIVKRRHRRGIPKGPDYSRWGYEYWYDPDRNLSSKMLIFSLQVLVSFIVLLAMAYIYGKYNNLF